MPSRKWRELVLHEAPDAAEQAGFSARAGIKDEHDALGVVLVRTPLGLRFCGSGFAYLCTSVLLRADVSFSDSEWGVKNSGQKCKVMIFGGARD